MRRGGGQGPTPTLPPRLLPGRAPTEAGSPEKGLEREAQERSPPYALPRESSRAQGRRAKNIKNSQQRRGFGFRTTVGARTLGALPSLSPGNSPQGAGRRQAGSEEREFPRLGQGASTRPAPREEHRISKLLAKKPLREPQGSHFSFLIHLCGAAAPGAAREEGVVSKQSQLPRSAAVPPPPPPPPLAGGVTETLSLISPRSGAGWRWPFNFIYFSLVC